MSYDYIAILSKITEHRRQAYETPNEKKDGDKLHHLQQSFDTFSSFSNDCPMTPMLWMQYAFDASEVVENLLLTAGNDSESSKRQAFETRRSILELGLNEFPGCAFLRLMNFDTLLFCTTSSFSDTEKRDEEMSLAEQLFETSLASVGLGSHRNDDTCIVTLYRIWIRFLLKSHVVSENNGSITDNGKQKIRQLFQRRARIPTKNGNDTIIDEIQTLDQEYNLKMTPRDYALVDEGKRFASKYFGRLTIFEDDVEASMAQDNIVSSSLHHLIENENSSSELINWEEIVKPGNQHFLMGLGMMETATSFCKYARFVSNYERNEKKKEMHNKRKQSDYSDEEEEHQSEEKIEALQVISSLTFLIYERAVSECPTVEMLWESYIIHLFYVIKKELDNTSSQSTTLTTQLEGVCARAVRNCPYSEKLFTLKLKAIEKVSEIEMSTFEPDDYTTVINDAIGAKFLPTREACLNLHMVAHRIIRNQIMNLISKLSLKKFDEAELMQNAGKKKKRSAPESQNLVSLQDYLRYGQPLSSDSQQEVQDLIEDLRDMHDATDLFLRKEYNNWTEGRSRLFLEKAHLEAYILTPLTIAFNTDNKMGDTMTGEMSDDEAIVCFEKLVRVHSPPHPNSWREYIRYISGKKTWSRSGSNITNDTPGMIVARFRFVRGLYLRSMSTVKKLQQELDENDGLIQSSDSALQLLCNEFIEFEHNFGSDESMDVARKLTTQKFVRDEVQQDQTYYGRSTEDKTEGQMNKGTKRKIPEITKDFTSAQQDIVLENSNKDTSEASLNKVIKRKKTDDNSQIPIDQGPLLSKVESQKIQSCSETMDDNNASVQNKINQVVDKVRIGKLDYPAHPFTIHVSNLSFLTEDMDLVDFFRGKCGAIVHARIFRDKIEKKSKGSGLIQFEDKSSVEKALTLSGEIGLNERLLKIERSHHPAVGLVQHDMSRLNAKGNGKYSKRNAKRKERREQQVENKSHTRGNEKERKNGSQELTKKLLTSKNSSEQILSMVPRGVSKRKKKVIL